MHKKECAALAQEYSKTHKPKMATQSVGKSTDRNTGYKKWEVSNATVLFFDYVGEGLILIFELSEKSADMNSLTHKSHGGT